MAPRGTRDGPGRGSDDWLGRAADDPVREMARRFVVNLRQAMGQSSLREISALTGVSRSSLSTILRGERWPDMETVARLEIGLGLVLWPRNAQVEAPADRNI